MDRRIIYAMLAGSIILALLHPIGLTAPPSTEVRAVYNFIEALPAGSVVWMGFDYYQSTITECSPSAEAVSTHLFRRNCRLVVTSTIPDGAAVCQPILRFSAAKFGKKYGEDYVILGYQTGGAVLLKQFSQDIQKAYPKDQFGTPISKYPLTAGLHNYHDIAMVFTVTDNQTFEDFVKVVNTNYKIPVASAMTAVMVPGAYTYVNAHQLLGVLGGLRGAAEYETLMGEKGTATSCLDALSFAHFLIAFFIVLSNVLFFIERSRGARRRG